MIRNSSLHVENLNHKRPFRKPASGRITHEDSFKVYLIKLSQRSYLHFFVEETLATPQFAKQIISITVIFFSTTHSFYKYNSKMDWIETNVFQWADVILT